MAESFTKKATQYHQTDRTGWVTTMTVQEIAELAPKRGPEQLTLFTETNRPITPRHLDSIERFLDTTPNWAMPAIVLAVNPGAVAVRGANITLDPQNLKTLDGQHRIQAIDNLVHQYKTNPSRDPNQDPKAKLETLSQQEMPVVILQVHDDHDQRQLFAWFARNRPIEPTVRDYFDNTDPFNTIAKKVMWDSRTLGGERRVTYQVRSVPARSKQLLSLSNLNEIVTTIRQGTARAPRAADRAACWDDEVQQHLYHSAMEFFDDFLPSCRPNYQILADLDQYDRLILNERSTSYATFFHVIRLVANAWARWTQDPTSPPAEKLANHIGSLRLQRADPTNDIEHTLEVFAGPRKKPKGLRDPAWEQATATITGAARNS